MKRPVAVAASALLLAAAAPAAAKPLPSFTATPDPAVVNQPVTLDASSSVCEFGPCGYSWRWLNGSRLGVQLGSGIAPSYRFTTAGWKTVELRMTDRCFAGSSNICAAIAYRSLFVGLPA